MVGHHMMAAIGSVSCQLSGCWMDSQITGSEMFACKNFGQAENSCWIVRKDAATSVAKHFPEND